MKADIGLSIKKIRAYRNYSQAYMATKLKIRQNTYSNIENGIIAVKPERLEKIAQILDVTVDNIINGETHWFDIGIKQDNHNNYKDVIAQVEKMTRIIQNELHYLREQNDAIIKALEINLKNQQSIPVNKKKAKKIRGY